MFSKTAGKISSAVLEFENNVKQIDLSSLQQVGKLRQTAQLNNDQLFTDFFAEQLEKLEDPKQLADLNATPEEFRKQLENIKQVFQNADVESLNTDLRQFLDKSASEALKKN